MCMVYVLCVCVRKREFWHRHRCAGNCPSPSHDVVKWKHFPRYWPFVRRIDRSPVNSLNKNKCRGALVFSLIYSWTNSWLNKQKDAGDLRRHVIRNLPSIYLRVYSLHHNVLPTLQSIPLMTSGPLYPITQDSSCHGQHTMPRNPWSFPWPVPHSCVCMNVCVLQWRKVCVVVL